MDTIDQKSKYAKLPLSCSLFRGFTLVELLVSIVIIGLLSAVALPSYLNQAAKARGTEAKSSLGSINRTQQAYRWANNIFASDITFLDIRLSQKFYDYSITSANSSDSQTTTITKQDGLKSSSAGITQNGDQFSQIVCESRDTQVINTSATTPTGGGGSPLGCPNNYKNID